MIPCIKICGLTTPQEAEYLIVNEVEYAGCVMFYEKSRRNNTPESASEIVKALTTPIHICDEVSCKIVTPDIKKVAVVVSPTVEQVKIIENIGFDIIQIHGNMSEDVLNMTKIPIIRAVNVSSDVSVDKYLNEPKICGILFDGKIPGNGEIFDWQKIKGIDRNGKLLILAGGLNSKNVLDGIREVEPDVVDVSSGVEYLADDNGYCSSGKNPVRIKEFVQVIRQYSNNQ